MKKSTLIYIIVGLVALISAVAGALYVLKKRGILFLDDCCEFDYDDCGCESDDCQCNLDDVAEVIEEKSKKAVKKAADTEE